MTVKQTKSAIEGKIRNPMMKEGKRIPLMHVLRGPFITNEHDFGHIQCMLHPDKVPESNLKLSIDPDGCYTMNMGEPYYSIDFSIAEGEWMGTSMFVCESCKGKVLAESEATKEEIRSE